MTFTLSEPPIITPTASPFLAKHVLTALIKLGIKEFSVCPAGRNAPLVYLLADCKYVNIYQWPEERSAAFFALGRIKATAQPAVVITTSGTAAAELLPAMMEAYYGGLPLIAITADRPRRFRGSGAPQSAEQVGLFKGYVHDERDLEGEEELDLSTWMQQGPLHLNLCFEEPNDVFCQSLYLDDTARVSYSPPISDFSTNYQDYFSFIKSVKYPFIIVGALPVTSHALVRQFLLMIKAPIYLEGLSGLREDPALDHIKIKNCEKLWELSELNGYPIDGILRIGNVPTHRLWRDLEESKAGLAVCSLTDLPFSGLSHCTSTPINYSHFFTWALNHTLLKHYPVEKWIESSKCFNEKLCKLFDDEPFAEPSLVHALSTKIPHSSLVYLGNSLPIREWDLSATHQTKNFSMHANRGVNGIDGQLATFLGTCQKKQDNWALLGDLTVLYDLVAPWIFKQLKEITVNVVIINNQGGQIFSRMYAHPFFQNTHTLSFEHLAAFWQWHYEKWTSIPSSICLQDQQANLIELVPQADATHRFWKALKEL